MVSTEGDVLQMVERLAYTVIALVLAIYLLNLVLAIGQNSYGSYLLNGISVFLVIGSIILILTVAYNVFAVFQHKNGKTGGN